MAEGTRMKQLEAKLDTMELGLQQIQEEVSRWQKENVAIRETVQTFERSVQTFEREVKAKSGNLG